MTIVNGEQWRICRADEREAVWHSNGVWIISQNAGLDLPACGAPSVSSISTSISSESRKIGREELCFITKGHAYSLEKVYFVNAVMRTWGLSADVVSRLIFERRPRWFQISLKIWDLGFLRIGSHWTQPAILLPVSRQKILLSYSLNGDTPVHRDLHYSLDRLAITCSKTWWWRSTRRILIGKKWLPGDVSI